jgi:hypothetical protein
MKKSSLYFYGLPILLFYRDEEFYSKKGNELDMCSEKIDMDTNRERLVKEE